MSGNIEIANTGEARTCCQTLDAGIAYYENLIAELSNAKDKIQTNWEGDSAALSDVVLRIDSTIAIFNTTITAMKGLSSNVVAFADKIDEVSNNTVGSGIANSANGVAIGAVNGVTNPGNGSASTTSTTKEKPGFWEYHGNNFAEAWTSQNWADSWDYSGCDSGLDYVGATVDALVDSVGNGVDAVLDTAGAAVNFVVDGVSEILGWLF